MKTQVYSWRLSSELKSDLERAARARGVSVSALLDIAVREWLGQSASGRDDEEEQRRLHAAAARCFGAFASGDPHASANTGQKVREKLRQRYGR